jgi:hypothetical protein
MAIAAGPLAFFVQGHEIVIPAGTLAQAKIAQDLQLPAQPDASPSALATDASESVTLASDKNSALVPPPSLSPAGAIPEDAATPSTITKPAQEPKE